jgi:hypothetical protein
VFGSSPARKRIDGLRIAFNAPNQFEMAMGDDSPRIQPDSFNAREVGVVCQTRMCDSH